MVFDWLKTQKKPPRTNQIRVVLTTKFKSVSMRGQVGGDNARITDFAQTWHN